MRASHLLTRAAGCVLVAAGTASVGAVPAWAHANDEVLQQAYVSLSTTRLDVELDLSPGELVGPAVAAALDTDHDEQLSQHEIAVAAGAVHHGLSLSVDGHTVPLTAASRSYPSYALTAAGGGVATLLLSADLPPGSRRVVLVDDYDPGVKTSVQMSVLLPGVQAADVTRIAHATQGRTLEVTVASAGSGTTAPSPAATAAGDPPPAAPASPRGRVLPVPMTWLGLLGAVVAVVVGRLRFARRRP